MTPLNFLDRYHKLTAWMDDWSMQTILLSKYVSGCVEPVWGERVNILQGLYTELKPTLPKTVKSCWGLPEQMSIEGYPISKTAIVRVYCGKGSPDEISDVIWLAHRFGLITNPAKPKTGSKTAQIYATTYLGIDCNSFTGNCLGINPSTSIPTYSAKCDKVTAVEDIGRGSILVSVIDESKEQEHIAMLDWPPEDDYNDDYTIVEWGTSGQDKHTKKIKADQFKSDSKGHLYLSYTSGAAKNKGKKGKKFVYARPNELTPRGYTMGTL